MKKPVIILIAVIFFILNFPIFGEGIRDMSVPSAHSETGSSVWKVTKDGKTMYLGGSIHVLRNEDFPLPQEFEHAFYASELIALETDAEKIADPEVVEYIFSRVFLPGKTVLSDLLEPETYDLLAIYCLQNGFTIEQVAKIKPSMVVNMLIVQQMEKYGFAQEGVDMYFLVKAKEYEKQIYFLESVQSQIDIIVTMGDGYENEYVIYSLEDMENTEEGIETLVAEWKNGTSTSTEDALREMKNTWPNMYKSLITDRHDAWFPQIEKLFISGKTCFLIVGLAHMYGEDGLLTELEKSGYSIEKFTIPSLPAASHTPLKVLR
ncbi:MAG: TraB/GumN family protein [Treponema sp.]|nr:TraB/GumN family protein [Treponema sp.]